MIMLEEPLYKNTQTGLLLIVAIDIAVLFAAYYGIQYSNWLLLATAAFLAIVTLFFGSLTVEGYQEYLLVKFGVGLIRRRVDYRMIVNCTVVKNPWYYGWGLKKIPNGYLYNVAGFDAVELNLISGKVFRIGTNQPEELANFIRLKIAR